jgi:hypothetical protein
MATLFVSHSSKDNAVTREVQAWLLRHGYGPVFVDFDRDDGLVGGRAWWPQLSEQIERARVFLAFVSPHWLASTPCHEEWTIARHEGKPILILLVGTCALPDALSQLHYIDFVERRQEAWEQLARALEEAGASPALFRPHPERPPFPGLSAFDVEDAGLYFGRETEVADVLERLGRLRRSPKRLFAIAGPSGAGKSSLLRAGVLARLRRRPTEWLPLVPLRPGQGWELGLSRVLEETCRSWYQAVRSRAALRDALIATAEGADALPLVAFTLGALWEEHGQEDGRLTTAHLEQLGGVGGPWRPWPRK